MPIKKQVDREIFKKWSNGMAYSLGFFAADGNIVLNKRGASYFSFYSSDRPILEKIRDILKSNHKLSKRSTKSGNVYRIQIGSKEMVNDLIKLGFEENKSKRLHFPKIPKKYRGEFIRGYFDGDGNVWQGNINNKRKNPTSILQVSFTSSNKLFLNRLLKVLSSMGLGGGSIYSVKDKNCFRLNFSTLDSLKLYKIMYNRSCSLYLERKKKVFEKFINMRA